MSATEVARSVVGALVWGVLPIRRGISWETHLAAALIGVALAFALRTLDVPPKLPVTALVVSPVVVVMPRPRRVNRL